MGDQCNSGSRRGFALHEALVVVGLAAVVAGALAPAFSQARRESSLAVCLMNLQTFELGSMSHVADRQDLLPNFDWIGFNGSTWTSPSQYPDLRGPFTNTASAHAAQAIDIIRRRSGRDDFPIRTGWIPNVLYSHLPLLDYLGDSLPSTLAACPDNEVLLKWQFTDLYDAGAFLPYQPVPGPSTITLPYGSSYLPNLAAWDFNASQEVNATSGQAVSSRVSMATSSTWSVPGAARFGGTMLSQVAFPAHKLHFNDDAQRHSSSPGMFYGFDAAFVTMSFFDGSVDRRRTGRANLGWVPNLPTLDTALVDRIHSVAGRPWLDPIPGGGDTGLFKFRYLTTRCGLLGIDYGAPAPPCGLP